MGRDRLRLCRGVWGLRGDGKLRWVGEGARPNERLQRAGPGQVQDKGGRGEIAKSLGEAFPFPHPPAPGLTLQDFGRMKNLGPGPLIFGPVVDSTGDQCYGARPVKLPARKVIEDTEVKMRALKFGLLCAVLAVCGPGFARGAKPDTTAEVKWAKGIADDFWRAVFAGQEEQAAGLLSPGLSKSLVEYDISGAGEKTQVLAWPAGRWLAMNLPQGPGASFAFDSQELSPDRAEVVFRGHLAGKDMIGEKVASNFLMRIARERAGGTWCIRFLLVTKRMKTNGKDQ